MSVPLVRGEYVRFENRLDDGSEDWKEQCQHRLNIPDGLDPMNFLPAGCASYQDGLRLASTKVYNEAIYQSILGVGIEVDPQALKAISIEKSNEPDPCDPTKTKGQSYVWLDVPSHFNLRVDGNFFYKLRKVGNGEAERLVPRSLFGRVKRTIAPEPGNVLRIPNTINNLGVLFSHLIKKGSPSAYVHQWKGVSLQHGDEMIPSGRICMREDVIARNRLFDGQKADAAQMGVEISPLGHRVLFNLLRHAETNVYPDGIKPRTFARTSTTALDNINDRPWPVGCGFGDASGLSLGRVISRDEEAGVAVALPAEV